MYICTSIYIRTHLYTLTYIHIIDTQAHVNTCKLYTHIYLYTHICMCYSSWHVQIWCVILQHVHICMMYIRTDTPTRTNFVWIQGCRKFKCDVYIDVYIDIWYISTNIWIYYIYIHIYPLCISFSSSLSLTHMNVWMCVVSSNAM